jgi:hypothetical protein
MYRPNRVHETLRDVLDDLHETSFVFSSRANAPFTDTDDGATSDDDTLTDDGADPTE